MEAVNLADLTFPTHYDCYGKNLASRVWQLLGEAVPQWQSSGLLDKNNGFGVAVANPKFAGHFSHVWNSPIDLVGFVVSWGPEGERYVANAIRKMRATARTGQNTLSLVQNGGSGQFRISPNFFHDAIRSSSMS